jgi:hypothetical protein
MMTTALLPAGLVVVALAAFPPFNAEEIAQEFISGVAGSERWLQGLYPEGNAPGALQDTLVFLLRLAPGAGFLSMLLAAFAAYVLCQRWFLRHRVELPAIPPFSCWKIWDHLVWLLALGIGLVLLGNARAAAVGWNLILVMGALYLLQGLAVLRCPGSDAFSLPLRGCWARHSGHLDSPSEGSDRCPDVIPGDAAVG